MEAQSHHYFTEKRHTTAISTLHIFLGPELWAPVCWVCCSGCVMKAMRSHCGGLWEMMIIAADTLALLWKWQNHKMAWVERELKDHPVPILCCGQGCHPSDHIIYPFQPGSLNTFRLGALSCLTSGSSWEGDRFSLEHLSKLSLQEDWTLQWDMQLKVGLGPVLFLPKQVLSRAVAFWGLSLTWRVWVMELQFLAL